MQVIQVKRCASLSQYVWLLGGLVRLSDLPALLASTAKRKATTAGSAVEWRK